MPPECSPGKPPPPLNNNLKKNKIKRDFTSSIYFKRKINNNFLLYLNNLLKQFIFTFYLFVILIFLPFGNAQFGEIASAISSLVAGGAGSGLAGGLGTGLGTGLGSAIGTGASAGAGAAGALGNIGQLYQLAQAALQLTGTGVGIANQASESAWFPVVVENAARMNKDFQDRLFNGFGNGQSSGGGGSGINGGIKSSSKLTTNIGSEYGKEFGGEGGGGDGGGGIIEGNSLNGRIINTELPYSPSHFTLIPDLFTTTNNRIAKLLPGEIDSNSNNNINSLLKGNLEETNNNFNKNNIRGNRISTGKKFIGVGSIEEIPLSPPQLNIKNNFKENVLLPGESNGQEEKEEVIETTTKIKIIKKEKIETNFNIDEEENKEKLKKEKEEIEKLLLLEPLIPSNPLIESLNMTIIENSDLSEMVPELGKLLGHLKMGNLTKLEFEELEKQLKEENNNNEGKENTSPLPPPPSSSLLHQNEKEIGDDIINNRKGN
uniref:Candidate secreted effector n=1 Tax=Meloidogyne incognita TaxID=6306 RepID=A0A914MHQ9_MELIC